MKNWFLLLFLLRAMPQATSLSSPRRLSSQLRAYHFGQTAESPTPKAAQPQTRSKSYIPTGLTEEQYAQIKLDDAAKLEGDLGAWGPRWKKVSGDPQGNWFSMPGLWTGGYSRQAVGEEMPKWIVGDDITVGRFRNLMIRCVLGIQRYGLAYAMLVLSTSYALSKKQLTTKWIASRFFLPLLALKPIGAIVDRFSLKKAWLREYGVVKLAAGISMLVSLVAFLLKL